MDLSSEDFTVLTTDLTTLHRAIDQDQHTFQTSDKFELIAITSTPSVLRSLGVDETDVCDPTVVAAGVTVGLLSTAAIPLAASARLGGRAYIERAGVDKFHGRIEVVHLLCDESPMYVSKEDLEELECLSEDKRNARILKEELTEFLQNGDKDLSWFLCKHHKLVRRTCLTTLVDYFRQESMKQKNCLVVRKLPGTGGRTLIRHLLYELRDKYVCVVLKHFQQKDAKLQAFLRELKYSTELTVVVFLDIPGSKDAAREFLSARGVKFVYTADHSDIDASTDQIEVVDLPPHYDDNENEQYTKLDVLKKHSIVIGGHCLDSYLSTLGFLDFDKIKENKTVMEVIEKLDYEELRRSGLYPVDILCLKGGLSQRIVSNRLSPMLFGLLSIDPRYYQQAKAYIQQLLSQRKEYLQEVQALKLCVLYALFAPMRAVPVYLINFILFGKRTTEMNDLPATLRCFLTVSEDDEQSFSVVSVCLPALTYILADFLFGLSNVKSVSYRQTAVGNMVGFFKDVFFPMATSDEFGYDTVEKSSIALIDMFCDFKAWNLPWEFKWLSDSKYRSSSSLNNSKTPVKTTDFWANSFFIELIHDCYHTRTRHGYDIVNGLFEVLLDIYQQQQQRSHDMGSDSGSYDVELELFTTHYARYISYQARKSENICDSWGLLDKATGLCLSLPKHDSPVVQDRLGNIGRDRIFVLNRCLSAENLCEGIVVSAGDGKSEPIRVTVLDTTKIAKDAHTCFCNAQRDSRYMWTYPLIGAVQLWLGELKLVAKALGLTTEKLQGYIETPVYRSGKNKKKPAQTDRLPDISVKTLESLAAVNISSHCYNYLVMAKHALSSRVQRDTSTHSHRLVTTATISRTRAKIVQSRKDLDAFFHREDTDLVTASTPLSLTVEQAHRTFLSIEFSRRVEEKDALRITYCMLAFATKVVHFLPRYRSAKLGPAPTNTDGLRYFELFFDLCTTLTCFESLKSSLLQSASSQFFVVLKESLSASTAKAAACGPDDGDNMSVEDLISFFSGDNMAQLLSNVTDSLPIAKLPVYTATVAFHLWQIVFRGQETAIGSLKSAVEKMREEASKGNYRHVDKARLFVAAQPAIDSLCFTAFYRYQDLPFETANLSDHFSMERAYAANGDGIFYKFAGVVKVNKRQITTKGGQSRFVTDMFVEWRPFDNCQSENILQIECDRCYHDTRYGYRLGDVTFEDGDCVNFHLIIRENIGLFAIGLSSVQPDT